tara:strand:- start:74 stop:412 length:339 start_codon:yes stop_codon:yes gene_type:complete
MDEKKDKFDFLNSIKVLITPWDKGFSCGIILDSRSKMSDEQYELVSTIARGMIKQATTDPHSTFLAGIRGFADDRKYRKANGGIDAVARFSEDDKIIDFLKYLQRKRNQELN